MDDNDAGLGKATAQPSAEGVDAGGTQRRFTRRSFVGGAATGALGAAVLGVEGGELMAMFEIAMMGRLPYTVLKDAIFAHPTLAESLNNLFMAMDK